MTNCQTASYTRLVLHSLVVLVCLGPLGGCSGLVERRWSEEVKLDDSKTISINRFVKFRESNSLAGDAYNASDLNSTLAFQVAGNEMAVWSAPLVPILLYYDAGPREWVIVATTSNCDTWFEHGMPVPPYWEFRHEGSGWVRVKLSAASIGRKTNLFFNYEPPLPARHLTNGIKDNVLARHDFSKKYLRVISELKSNCQ